MFALLISIFILHIANIVLLFVATIDNAWWVSANGSNVLDLWQSCIQTADVWNCIAASKAQEPWLQAVQALMILSVILACLALGLFVFQLYRLKKGGRFVISGGVLLLASLCVIAAAAVYTGQYPSTEPPYNSGNFGHSYIIAWVAAGLTFINGLIYVFLRKRS